MNPKYIEVDTDMSGTMSIKASVLSHPCLHHPNPAFASAEKKQEFEDFYKTLQLVEPNLEAIEYLRYRMGEKKYLRLYAECIGDDYHLSQFQIFGSLLHYKKTI